MPRAVSSVNINENRLKLFDENLHFKSNNKLSEWKKEGRRQKKQGSVQLRPYKTQIAE